MRTHAQFSQEDLKDDGEFLIRSMQDRGVPIVKMYALVCFIKHFLEKELSVTNVEYGPQATDSEAH